MTKSVRTPRPLFRPALLATTSAAAILLGSVLAQAGQTITNQTVATVLNAAGNVTSSIVIVGSTVTGAVTNAGSITPGINLVGPGQGIGVTAALAVLNGATVGGGITNTGTISVSGTGQAAGVLVFGNNKVVTVSGGVQNSGTLSVTAGSLINAATGIVLSGSAIAGGVTNSGTINASGFVARGIEIAEATVTGGVANNGIINLNGIFLDGIGAALSTITGGISNSGAITGNGTKNQAFGILVDTSTIVPGAGAGIGNSGTITLNEAGGPAIGIEVLSALPLVPIPGLFAATINGGIVNSGTIIADGGTAEGVRVQASVVSSGVTNSGLLSITGVNSAIGITVLNNSTISGGISNTGTIIATASGAKSSAGGFVVRGSTVGGGLTNAGNINLIGGNATGIEVIDSVVNKVIIKSTISGGISNSGTITASGGSFATGIDIASSIVSGAVGNSGTISVTGGAVIARGFEIDGSVSGDVTNAGTITGNGLKSSIGIEVGAVGSNLSAIAATISGGVSNSGSIAVTGGVSASGILVNNGSTIAGGITNSGKITASSPGGVAIGIGLGVTHAGQGAAGKTATITGGVRNTGTITATGGKSGIGIAVIGNTPITGGIVNTGTITGSTASISLAAESGVTNTVTQAGGTLAGSALGSGNTNGDVLNVAGGKIVLAGGQSISGFGTYNQSGGTLVFNVTSSTAAGTYPTLSAGTINLTGGTFELAPSGNLFALATQRTSVYKNVIVADPPLNGSFAAVTSPITLFSASLSPNATTPNALDATLTLSQAGLAASAQDLTQDGRLGLDAPRVLKQAVQDRLVASGGVLGEDNWTGDGAKAPGLGLTAPSSIGHPDAWVRGFDQFGTATAQAASAGVGYDVNRAAPLIGGVDWRLDNGFVVGAAATYVATSAKFKDGSSTNVNSYQGAAYTGWAGGPWYALGSVVASFNDFGTARLLTPSGLPGAATSSPSGQSYQGHAEAGYRWVLPAGGVNVSVTPYAALDYVNAQVQGFSETGGFGALAVNSTDSNSFQTTLGVRLTSRIVMASYGTLIPELRLGWNHEFGDASQKITAALVGVPGSTFSATGIAFGRDTALVGAGLSMELSPDAKVFVDYDGKLGSRLQEHSVSGGVRVRF